MGKMIGTVCDMLHALRLFGACSFCLGVTLLESHRERQPVSKNFCLKNLHLTPVETPSLGAGNGEQIPPPAKGKYTSMLQNAKDFFKCLGPVRELGPNGEEWSHVNRDTQLFSHFQPHPFACVRE